MTLCIIPARGGSKRIPRKNIKPFCGQPMIAYSIQAALASGCFERIIVSTDDAEIAQVARQYGAEVPFTRPPELSDDFATTGDVVRHTLQSLSGTGHQFEYICCLYATAPFIQPQKLAEGLHHLKRQPSADFALAVTAFSFPPQRALHLNATGYLAVNSPESFIQRSQDLPTLYHDAGQFLWGHLHAWSNAQSFFTSNVLPILLPSYLVQDIDTAEDWHRAELLYHVLMSLKQQDNS